MGLVRGAVRHYCLGGCSAPVVCARRSRPVRGAGAGAGFCVFSVSSFPPRVSRAVCGRLSRRVVPYPRSLVRHSMRSARSAGLVRLPFWYSPRVVCVCVRSRSRGVRPPPPPTGSAGGAHLARSRCWAPVGLFHAVRALLRVLPRSRAPFGLLGGGPAWSRPPPAWLGVVCPPSGNPQRALLRACFARCGGGTRAPGGGRLLPGWGTSEVGRSPTPNRSSFAACSRGPLPTGCGCQGCGRQDLSLLQKRPLL